MTIDNQVEKKPGFFDRFRTKPVVAPQEFTFPNEESFRRAMENDEGIPPGKLVVEGAGEKRIIKLVFNNREK